MRAENWRHRRADGTIFDADIYSRKLHYRGRLARFSVVLDITERRRAERERDRNREFLDLIVENVPSIIVVKDARDMRYVLVNKAGAANFGIPRSRIIGKTVYELFRTASAEVLAALDRQLLQTGSGPLVAEHAVDTPGQGVRIGVSKRLLIRDDRGEPQYLLAVIDDVTERRRLEAERDRNREFLDRVIENVPMTVFVRGARDNRYILVNREAETLWGISRDKIIGRTRAAAAACRLKADPISRAGPGGSHRPDRACDRACPAARLDFQSRWRRAAACPGNRT